MTDSTEESWVPEHPYLTEEELNAKDARRDELYRKCGVIWKDLRGPLHDARTTLLELSYLEAEIETYQGLLVDESGDVYHGVMDVARLLTGVEILDGLYRFLLEKDE